VMGEEEVMDEEEREEEEEEEEDEWGPEQSALLTYLIDYQKKKKKWTNLKTSYFSGFEITPDGLRQKYKLIRKQRRAYHNKGRDTREGKEFLKILRRLDLILQQDSESSDEEEKKRKR